MDTIVKELGHMFGKMLASEGGAKIWSLLKYDIEEVIFLDPVSECILAD